MRHDDEMFGSGKAAGEPLDLKPVDILTLSRAAAGCLIAAVALTVSGRRKTARYVSFGALLYGSVLCDWLDGPLARRSGTTYLGSILDLEADSWLTLCAAFVAVSWGGLPRSALLGPLARYPLLLWTLRRRPYESVRTGQSPWVRHLGMAQMALILAALAPFAGPVTGLGVRIGTALLPAIQAAGLTLQFGRSTWPGRIEPS